MFIKYDKTFRLTTPNINVKGKFCLTEAEQKNLLGAKVYIEEKVDGANVGVVRHKQGWTLQKRRGLADEGSHAQYSFFWNWARHNHEKIMDMPIGSLVYCELCYAQHHVRYDILPSYILVFDIWNGKIFLNYEMKKKFCEVYNLKMVPLLFEGYVSKTDLDKYMYIPSLYSTTDQAEGIVVKRYHKKHGYTRGKLVRPEFMKEIEEEDHWMGKPTTKNKLAEGVDTFA